MPVGLKMKGNELNTWLKNNANSIKFPDSYSDVPEDKMVIMWVKNYDSSIFTEIIRGSSEYDYFSRVLPEETRYYKVYIADKNITIDNADDDLSFLKYKEEKEENKIITKFKKFFT